MMVDGPSGVNGPSVTSLVVEEGSTVTGHVLLGLALARHPLRDPAMNTHVEVS